MIVILFDVPSHLRFIFRLLNSTYCSVNVCMYELNVCMYVCMYEYRYICVYVLELYRDTSAICVIVPIIRTIGCNQYR